MNIHAQKHTCTQTQINTYTSIHKYIHKHIAHTSLCMKTEAHVHNVHRNSSKHTLMIHSVNTHVHMSIYKTNISTQAYPFVHCIERNTQIDTNR